MRLSWLSFVACQHEFCQQIIYVHIITGEDRSTPFALVGPVCNVATDLIATIVSRYTSTVQVSYGVASPVFSDVNAYPFFYSTVPAYTEYVKPITAILENFNWNYIGLVVRTDSIPYALTAEALSRFLRTRSNQFEVSAFLSSNTFIEFSHNGRSLQDSARIFIALINEKDAADLLCAAFQSGQTGSEYLWILLGEYTEGWWRSLRTLNCTDEQMLSAIESTLMLTNSVQSSQTNFTSIRQQNQSVFWKEFRTHLKANTGLKFEETRALRVLQSYDAVWSIANALNTTLAEEPDNDRSSVTDNRFPLESTREVVRLHIALNQNMKELVFQGTSGDIKFTNESNSPQSPITSIFQMQNGTIVPVGIHKMADQNVSVLNFTFFGNNLSWQGEGPPRDRPVLVFQVVELWIIVIMLILTALGIAYAIVILIVNCVYRKHKVIKASSPYINILNIIGCILGFLIIPVLSIENLDTDHVLPETVYLIFCNIRPWVIATSLTFAFGALFAKTWRVYMIFRNPWAKARPYKDHVLLLIVGGLLLVDVIVLAIATWRTPLRLNVYSFLSSTGEFTINQYRICLEGEDLFTFSEEAVVWTVLVIILKILLFLFGIFLVIQTRKIKAKYFQETRFIGMAIYGTVIACGIGFPLSFGLMMFLQEDVGFVCGSATILFCSFFILSVVFIPRFVLLRKYKKRVPSAVLIELNPSFQELAIKRKLVLVGSQSTKGSNGPASSQLNTNLTPVITSPSDKLESDDMAFDPFYDISKEHMTEANQSSVKVSRNMNTDTQV